VSDQGDYTRTSLHKATAIGVVVGIEEIDLSSSKGGQPDEYIFELLREDGTYVFVRNTLQKGVALSLIAKPVRIGNFMKAIGNYDKDSNTIIAEGEGDMIKTYDFRP
jgi:hypothetical protein